MNNSLDMATAAATANYNTDYYTSYAKAAATSAADPLRDYYGHAYYQVVKYLKSMNHLT